MYNLQCTMYNLPFTMYYLQCTIYNVLFKIYHLQCTIYNVFKFRKRALRSALRDACVTTWSKKGQKHIAQGSALGFYAVCGCAL